MDRKIYIAGKMTGEKYFNFPSFDAYEDYYEKLGWETFNPAAHDRKLLGKPKDWMPTEKDSEGPWIRWAPEVCDKVPTLNEMLKADLDWICDNATAIHMLRGWENSKGARAEHALAHALGLEIRYT